MKFQKPDEKVIARMTVESVSSIIETLKAQRAEVVAPFDTQLSFYGAILKRKQEERERQKQLRIDDAETTS